MKHPVYIIRAERRKATPLRGTPMGAYHGRQGELARSLLSCALLSSFAFIVVFVFFAVSFESRSTHRPTITRPTALLLSRPALICFSFRLGSPSRRDADMIGRANDSSPREEGIRNRYDKFLMDPRCLRNEKQKNVSPLVATSFPEQLPKDKRHLREVYEWRK